MCDYLSIFFFNWKKFKDLAWYEADLDNSDDSDVEYEIDFPVENWYEPSYDGDGKYLNINFSGPISMSDFV